MGERPEKFYGKSSEGFEKTKRLAAQLLELCQTAAPALPEDLKDACRELEQRCEESTFRVVVLRMFSRGKSTFLNALIGRRLLYKSDREATARSHSCAILPAVPWRSIHRTPQVAGGGG